MPAGAPTKYKKKYIELVEEYLKITIDEIKQKTAKNKDGGRISKYLSLKVNLPTLEGYSQYINADIDVMMIWAKKEPKFKRALNKITREQKRRLLNSGLSGAYNPVIAKLILSANHGMNERGTEINITLPTPILQSIAPVEKKEIKEAKRMTVKQMLQGRKEILEATQPAFAEIAN